VENRKVIQSADRIIITKSKKDRLVLSKYLDNVINVQNETRACFTESFVEELRDKEVWINYDSDDAGVKNCIKITEEFKYNYINVPRSYLPIKDFADLYRLHGEEVLLETLKSKDLI
jgi:5S rRNA maturation endonuclease (ribonuclease M5)